MDFFKKTIDKKHKIHYNNNIKRDREVQRTFSKSSKKTLDKAPNLCYNRYVR